MASIIRELGTYYDYSRVYLTQEQQQSLVTGLLVACFCLMAIEAVAPEVAFLIALSVLNLSETLSLSDTLAGFANESLITIGTLFLVIGAVEKGHLIDYGSRQAFGTKSTYFWGKVRMFTCSFFISAFVNNIPVVAIMLPIIQDWAVLKGVSASKLLIPLSYSVLAGGMLATIGTSTNLVVNGLLEADGRETFNFFDPAVIGLPAGAALIVYMISTSERLLPNHMNKKNPSEDRVHAHILKLKIKSNCVFLEREVGDLITNLGIRTANFVKLRRSNKTPSISKKKDQTNIEFVASILSYVFTSPVPWLRSFFDNKFQKVKTDDDIHLELASISGTSKSDENEVVKSTESSKASGVCEWINSVSGYYAQQRRWFISEFLPRFFYLESKFDIVEEDYNDLFSNEYVDYYTDLTTVLQKGDELFIANAPESLEKIIKIMPWERHGISLFGDIDIIDLPSYGKVVLEVSVSSTNLFLNKYVREVCADFSAKFECLILSAKDNSHLIGLFDEKHPFNDTSSVQITVGTPICILTSEKNYERLMNDPGFICVSKLTTLKDPASYWSFIPLVVFVTIVSLVASEQIQMCPAALGMCSFLFVGGWLKTEDITHYIDLRLLMLLGTSFSFAKAMTTTELASNLALKLSSGIKSPTSALYIIYIATLVMTEVVSNNAAAALMYPIAVKLADVMGVSYKPFAMVVMNAASMAFMCPIGYPTHIMVWGPGKYSFFDFCKFGLIPNFLWLVVTCLIAPAVWTF